MKPLIFDIARASFEDGPGLRTVVFLKGCPLRCVWCQNPESQSPEAEMMFDAKKCIDCGNCRTGCHTLARRTLGEYYSPEHLARIILRDRIFYRSSSGGVTFSGGEPLMHIDYIYETAEILKRENLHITVETSGFFNFNQLAEALLPKVDLFLFDIKIMDPDRHRDATGHSNETILKNFDRLRKSGAAILPRIPLIPGFTMDENNLVQISRFLALRQITRYSLLPYNPSGIGKWPKLRKKPPPGLPENPLSKTDEQWCKKFFRQLETGTG